MSKLGRLAKSSAVILHSDRAEAVVLDQGHGQQPLSDADAEDELLQHPIFDAPAAPTIPTIPPAYLPAHGPVPLPVSGTVSVVLDLPAEIVRRYHEQATEAGKPLGRMLAERIVRFADQNDSVVLCVAGADRQKLAKALDSGLTDSSELVRHVLAVTAVRLRCDAGPGAELPAGIPSDPVEIILGRERLMRISTRLYRGATFRSTVPPWVLSGIDANIY